MGVAGAGEELQEKRIKEEMKRKAFRQQCPQTDVKVDEPEEVTLIEKLTGQLP